MTLATLRTAVRVRIGVSSADPTYPDATLTEFINSGLAYISSLRDWPWLETSTSLSTTAADNSFTAPTGFMRASSLTLNSQPYELTAYRNVVQGETAGMYYMYAVRGAEIVVYPTPTVTESGAGTLTYFRTEPALSSDSDVPLLPTHLQPGLCDYVAEMCMRRAGNVNEAEAWAASYAKWERRMLDEASRAAGAKRVYVRPGCDI